MNAAHLHLMLNHLPLVGIISGVLVHGVGLFRRNAELQRIALWLYVVAALITIPVYLSGEPAEEVIEDLPGVSHDRIEEHEDSGLFAFIGIGIAGAVAAVALALRQKADPRARVASTLALIVAIVSTTILARTALLGGQIRHPEVRPGFEAPAALGQALEPPERLGLKVPTY